MSKEKNNGNCKIQQHANKVDDMLSKIIRHISSANLNATCRTIIMLSSDTVGVLRSTEF